MTDRNPIADPAAGRGAAAGRDPAAGGGAAAGRDPAAGGGAAAGRDPTARDPVASRDTARRAAAAHVAAAQLVADFIERLPAVPTPADITEYATLVGREDLTRLDREAAARAAGLDLPSVGTA